MKKIVALLIAVAVLCSVSVPAFAAYKDEYKLSTVLGEAFPWGWGAKRWADLVAEKTEGRIKVEVYSGGQLYGEETGARWRAFMDLLDRACASGLVTIDQVVKGGIDGFAFAHRTLQPELQEAAA